MDVINTTGFEKRVGKEQSGESSGYDRALMALASNFINVSYENLDYAISNALRIVAEYCQADRAVIYRYEPDHDAAVSEYIWTLRPGDGVSIHPADLRSAHEKHRSGGTYIRSRRALQDNQEKTDGPQPEPCWNLICSSPILADGRLIGAAAFLSTGRRDSWSDSEITIIGIFGRVITNILIRKERESAVIESFHRNLEILDSINEGVCLFDEDGNILRVNRYLAEKFGRAEEECIGINIRQLFPSDQYGGLCEKWMEMLKQTFSSGEYVAFQDYLDGRWLNIRLYPIKDNGEIKAVTLLSSDITDGRTAKENELRNAVLIKETEVLRKKEEEYLEILDGSTEATWIIDILADRIEYSAQWLRRIGGENIAMENMKAFIDSLIHPDDFEDVVINRALIYENKLTKYRAEYRMKTADGNYIWVMDKGKVSYNEEGHPVKIYGTSADITEQKEAESLILRQNRILQTIRMIYEKAFQCDSITKLHTACMDIIENLTESEYSFIGEIGGDGGLYDIVFNSPICCKVGEKPPGTKKPVPNLIIGRLHAEIAETGRSYMLNAPLPGYPDITSLIGIPFMQDGRVTGMLAVANRKGGYSREHMNMLEAVVPTVYEVLIRKRTEETIRRNEILMRTIMDSSSDFMFIKNREGRIVMVNQAYGKIFGVDIQQVVGKDDYELSHKPDVAEKIIENDRYVMRTGETLVCEESVMTVSGEKTFLISKVPWRDQKSRIIGVLGIAHDITSLKRAEISLQESYQSIKRSKDYINILYETTGTILSSLSPMRDIHELCVKVMKFLDCHIFFNYMLRDEGQDLYLNSCDGITGDLKEELDRLSVESSLCGIAIVNRRRMVYENIQESDEPRTLLVKTLGIRSYACFPLMADNIVVGTLSFGSRSKDRLSDEDLMLIKTVSESISVAIIRKQNEEKLIRQTEELKTADRNKNEFLSALSHELRNPLATIEAGLSLLDATEDKLEQGKAKDIMRRQMEQLISLIDDLLDVTRITRNRIVLKKERMELTSMVKMIVDDMKTLFEQKGITLSRDIPADEIYIDADPVRIRQIIGNLLHNAMKFTVSGNNVKIAVYTLKNCAKIMVKDNGIGIDPKFMNNLFEPFMQADKSLERSNSGLGLGLSIVKGIAVLHGGSVTAYSEGLGKGSEFMISLPISDS